MCGLRGAVVCGGVRGCAWFCVDVCLCLHCDWCVCVGVGGACVNVCCSAYDGVEPCGFWFGVRVFIGRPRGPLLYNSQRRNYRVKPADIKNCAGVIFGRCVGSRVHMYTSVCLAFGIWAARFIRNMGILH